PIESESKSRALAPSDALIVRTALSAAADGALDASSGEDIASINADTGEIEVDIDVTNVPEPPIQDVTKKLPQTLAREALAEEARLASQLDVEEVAAADEDLDNAPTATRIPGERQSFQSIPTTVAPATDAPPPVPPPGPRPQIRRSDTPDPDAERLLG